MSDKPAYERQVTFRLDLHDGYVTEGAYTWRNETLIYIEEERKNGQEDCHQSGIFKLNEETQKWEPDPDETGWESFETYGWGVEEIVEYLNDNPPPRKEELSNA